MVNNTFGTKARGGAIARIKPYWGYRDEFAHALEHDLTLREFVTRHEELFRLRKEDGNIQPELPFTHAVAHALLGLALTLSPFPEKTRTPFYQANMQGEMIVLPVQYFVLDEIMKNPDAAYVGDAAWLLQKCDAFFDYEYRLRSVGLNGAKACYYIGKRLGKTMFEIGMAYNFHNGAQMSAAEEIAKIEKHSLEDAANMAQEEPHDWERHWWRNMVEEGDTYMANGEKQIVKGIVMPSSDPDTARILALMMPALHWIKAVCHCPDMIEDLTLRDLRDTMKEAQLQPVVSVLAHTARPHPA